MSGTALFQEARKGYHAALIKQGVLTLSPRKTPKAGKAEEVPSNADGDSATSIAIARAILDQIQTNTRATVRLAGQVSGNLFEHLTRDFIATTFGALKDIRPGTWDCSPAKRAISRFEQYHHLMELSDLAEKNPEMAVHLGSDLGLDRVQ